MVIGNCSPKAFKGLRFLLLVFIFSIGLSGCKALKGPEKSSAKVESLKSLKERVEAINPDFKWLNARIKVSIETPQRNLTGRGHMKIQKDSVVWLSVSAALGIEVFRAKITPDSFYTLNRMENQYRALPFQYVNQFTQTRQREFTFTNLTNLFIGQPLFPIHEDYEMQADTSAIQLTYDGKAFRQTLDLIPQTLKTQNFALKKPATNQGMTIRYADYEEVEGEQLPGEINITARKPEALFLEIKLNSISFKHSDNASFSVPDHYDKMH